MPYHDDDVGVVQQTIHGGRRDEVVEEERVPLFEGAVGGDDHRAPLVALPDGSKSVRDSVAGRPGDAEQLGLELASKLIEQGAREILEAAGAMHG